MRTFKLILAYDGTDYSGWQIQPGCRTVQAALEESLQKITGEAIRATASGRTDAGVHALGQVVSFTSQTQLSGEVLAKALNAELPRDLAVLSVVEAADDFHATLSATGKRYRYVIQDGPARDVFSRRYAWHVFTRLDVLAMRRAAAALVGTHDFSSFETHGSPRLSSIRTVTALDVERGEGSAGDRVTFEVEADGFLYNMVRTIVGTLVEVGRGRQSETWPADVLAARDRRAAGQTAPPQGLFLVRVDYDPTGCHAVSSERYEEEPSA